MPEAIKEWITNIVSLIVFITVIEIIIPGGKFKKYIHLVTGTVVVIAIITPLTGLAGKDLNFPDIQFKNAAIIEKSEFEKQKAQMQENQARQIASAYKKKLADQIRLQVMQSSGIKEKGECQVDVVINEDYNSSSFGEVKQVKVNLLQVSKEDSTAIETSGPSVKETESPVKSVKIDPVTIGKQDSKASNTASRYNVDEKTGKMVKDKVSSLLSISPELVLVNEQHVN